MKTEKTNPAYSLWKFRHEDPFHVTAVKIRDTNSEGEVLQHMESSWLHGASNFLDATEVDAQSIQFFTQND